MKKTVFLILILAAAALTLAACGTGSQSNAETTADATTYAETVSVEETDVSEVTSASETEAETTASEETTCEETLPEVRKVTPTATADALSADEYKKTDGLLAFCEGAEYAFVGNVGYDCKIPLMTLGGELFADAEKLGDMLGLGCTQDGKTCTLTYGNTSIKLEYCGEKAEIGSNEVDCTTVLSVDGRVQLPITWLSEFLGYTVTGDGKYLYVADGEAKITQEEKNAAMETFEKYKNIVCDLSDVECDQTGVGKYAKSDYSERLVGIAYTTWMRSDFPSWGSGTWDLPLLGNYCSDDRDVIYRHGVWLAEAGVDFVFVDWSNNTDYDPATMHDSRRDFSMIEDATDLLFEIWSQIPNAPKICIFVGPGHNGVGSVNNGNHQKKVDQVYNNYVNGKYKDMYFHYEGKPLLMCYGATPNQYGSKPKWTDDRFTVRWVTGYVGQQGGLFKAKELRSLGFWSWEERGAQTYTVVDGKVECVTCTASSRAQGNEGESGYIPAYGRDNGATLKKQFQRANDLGAKIVLLVSWNEWTTGEQLSPEISKDLEPSVTYGTFYYDLMCMQIKKFKGKA